MKKNIKKFKISLGAMGLVITSVANAAPSNGIMDIINYAFNTSITGIVKAIGKKENSEKHMQDILNDLKEANRFNSIDSKSSGVCGRLTCVPHESSKKIDEYSDMKDVIETLKANNRFDSIDSKSSGVCGRLTCVPHQ